MQNLSPPVPPLPPMQNLSPSSSVPPVPPVQNLSPSSAVPPIENLSPSSSSVPPVPPMQNLCPSSLVPPMQNMSPLSSVPSHPPMQNLKPPSSLPPIPDLINTPFHIAASITQFLDKKVIITLLDDQKLIGTLVSFDEFAVLEGAVERKIVGDLYCDISIGPSVICCEDLVLIEEMDSQKAKLSPQMVRVSEEEFHTAEKAVKDSLDN